MPNYSYTFPHSKLCIRELYIHGLYSFLDRYNWMFIWFLNSKVVKWDFVYILLSGSVNCVIKHSLNLNVDQLRPIKSFSLNRLTGPIQSWSCNVRLYVCDTPKYPLPENVISLASICSSTTVTIFLELIFRHMQRNKPAVQAAAADPSRCNSTNREIPPIQQFWCPLRLRIS